VRIMHFGVLFAIYWMVLRITQVRKRSAALLITSAFIYLMGIVAIFYGSVYMSGTQRLKSNTSRSDGQK